MIEECDHGLGVRHGSEDSTRGTWFYVTDICAVSRCSIRQATWATFDFVEKVLQRDEAFSERRGSMILR